MEKKHGVAKSEPELVLEIMERSPKRCAVIALVGGGQEIHTGEAGLEAWGEALNSARNVLEGHGIAGVALWRRGRCRPPAV